MPIYIIKMQSPKSGLDYFMEWSTISDSLYSAPMLIDDFRKYYLDKYPESSETQLQERIERVMKNGTSAKELDYGGVDSLMSRNRMWYDAKHLPVKWLVKRIYKQMDK